MPIKFVTDSTSDLPESIIKEYDIRVVPLYINLNNRSYLDSVDISREEFYKQLPTANPHPTTAAPSPGQFMEFYHSLEQEGATEIFSIHLSSSLSAILQSARTAASQFTQIPVYVVDSGNLSMGLGFIVLKAAQAAAQGMTSLEINEILNKSIPLAHAYAKLDTIDYLLRGGRLSAVQYNIVSLLGIKPILKINNHISRMEIARTRQKAFEKVVHMALEAVPKAELFGITHANAASEVNRLIERIKEQIPGLPTPLVSEVTPVLGVHVGPGALAINWLEHPHEGHEEKRGIWKWLPHNS